MLTQIILSLLLFSPLPLAFPQDTPKAVFPESRYVFGETRQGTMIEHEFVLKNEGTAVLRITGARMTAPLFLARTPAQILPGAEVKLRIQLNTSKLSGPFSGEVVIKLNDPALPEATLLFGGRVIPPIELLPRPVFFVAGQRGKDTKAAIDIVNHETEPLRIESVEHPRERFTTKLETIEEGRRYRLSLILNPNGPGGKSSADILIKTSSRTRPVINIAANTYLHERVYTFPEEVDLGGLRLADIKANPDLLKRMAQTLMVYQSNGTDFKVKLSTSLESLELKTERGPKGDRYQNTITLIADKVRPGPIEGSILIETNDPEFPTLKVPVHGQILSDK